MINDQLTKKASKVQMYNPKYGDHRLCVCGHRYADHFNPKTKKAWGCFWSYNCDCEGFEEDKSKVR